MPIWLQLVTAVSAGLVSALLGIALVPYLQKLRFVPPIAPKEDAPESAGEERRPIMGGLLLAAGLVFGVVLGGALFLRYSGTDRTAADFTQQLTLLEASGTHTVLLFAIGVICDWMIARGRYNPYFWDYVLIPLVLIAGIIANVFANYEAAVHNYWLVLLPVPAAVCFVWEIDLEPGTDGALLTVNAVELLFLTVLLLRNMLYLPSVLTLAAAGACLGSMVWCLHPAKCRIGKTGEYLLGALVPIVCLLCGLYKELALFMAIFALQQLYRLRRHENKYLTVGMTESGIAPLPRIAILAGIAVFCGVMALLLKS